MYCLLLLLLFVICCFCGEIYVGNVVFSPVHNKLMRMRIITYRNMNSTLFFDSCVFLAKFCSSC